MHAHLSELYRAIARLMDATSATDVQAAKAFFASLEYRARQYKQELEARLGTRN